VLSPPSEHPTFVKKHNMAIRPNKNWIATKVNFQPYARLQPSDQGCRFLSVFAPVLPRSWPTSLLCPTTQIDSLARESAIHPRQMVRNGFSAERGLSDFACIPTRIFTALDLNSDVQFSSVKREIPGLTPIVIRGRMRLYAPDDCSIVITSVRRVSSRFASRTQSDNSHYDLELKTPQPHVSGSNPPSVSMPGQDALPFPRRLRQRVVLG
jgi:hypothetical protein